MDKAVILARGLGTRMRRQEEGVELSDEQRAAADSGQKAMIRFGRPFLDYVLMRHFGEVGETLQAAYVERLERFRAQIIINSIRYMFYLP